MQPAGSRVWVAAKHIDSAPHVNYAEGEAAALQDVAGRRYTLPFHGLYLDRRVSDACPEGSGTAWLITG